MAILVEYPNGGAEEGKEEEYEDDLTLAGGRRTDGDCGTLKGGKGGSLLLHLGLGVLQLSCNSTISIKPQLHLILQVIQLSADTLEDDILVGIAERGVELTGLIVLMLSLNIELLVVFKIFAGFTGAIISDELLKAILDGVSNRGTDKRILIGDLNGDNQCLFINSAFYTVIDGFGDSGLLLCQPERINNLVIGEW